MMNQSVAAGEVNITLHFHLDTLNAMTGVGDRHQTPFGDGLAAVLTKNRLHTSSLLLE